MSQSTPSTTTFQTENSGIEAATKTEVRVVVVGNVDSGKSTLVGVLSKGTNDDGRGLARGYVFNYDHERESGRTSSIAHEIMGFREDGRQVLPERLTEAKNTMWERVVKASSHVIALLDLCGHERYLKTTMFGLVGLMPDYAVIVVGANSGITRITKEHLGLALALKLPIVLVVSKVDLAPAAICDQTVASLSKVMRTPGAGSRLPMVIREEDDMQQIAAGLEGNVTPIFLVSSVTGQGVGKLRELLRVLPQRGVQSGLVGKADDPVELHIDATYNAVGVGMVVAGVLRAGTIRLNQVLLLGPDGNGSFKPVSVRGIHFNRTAVDVATPGQSYCLAVKARSRGDQLTRSSFRKGMILADVNFKPTAIWEFDAEVVILHHATTIRENYQSMVHTGVVRQAAKVVSLSKAPMSTGDKGLVRFRFMYSPEVVRPGAVLLFREGKTKGLGVISSVYVPANP